MPANGWWHEWTFNYDVKVDNNELHLDIAEREAKILVFRGESWEPPPPAPAPEQEPEAQPAAESPPAEQSNNAPQEQQQQQPDSSTNQNPPPAQSETPSQ